MQLDSFTDAEESLRTAVAREAHFALAQNALANCLLRQGQAAEAVPHYEAALETAPDYADAHYNLGVAIEYPGNSLRAVHHNRQATDLDHLNTDAGSTIQRLSRNQ
jgi:tetratricopeptide (TPR) repeat protein